MLFDVIINILPITIIILSIVNIIVALWIFKDAKEKRIMGGIYYVIIELVFPVIGIILYIINKKKYL